MKTALTSLDLYYLVREFQEMEGARFDKAYEQADDKDEFLLVFHKSGSGKKMLRIKLPELCYLTEYKQVFPDSPPGFCMFLRKHLSGARIKQVRQKGFDRILELVFTTRDGLRILICELFSKGNLVLVDEDYKIRGLLKSQSWQARTVRGGAKYIYPPAQLNTPELSQDQFKKIISESDLDSVVKTMAVTLGLGGVYAEEACARAGVDKHIKKPNAQEINQLFSAVKQLFRQDIKANQSGEEVFPFSLVIKDDDQESFSSFNHALDEVFTDQLVKQARQEVTDKKQTQEDKIKKIIEQQGQNLEKLKQKADQNQRKGEMIYEHYQELKELLEKLNADQEKMDWKELKKKYSNNQLVNEINPRKRTITVDV